MFRAYREHDGPKVRVTINGRPFDAFEGETVASAILRSDSIPSRETPVTGSPRAPYCMMGTCFECLMQIDGIADRQSCMIVVQPGMVIDKQLGAPVLSWALSEQLDESGVASGSVHKSTLRDFNH